MTIYSASFATALVISARRDLQQPHPNSLAMRYGDRCMDSTSHSHRANHSLSLLCMIKLAMRGSGHPFTADTLVRRKCSLEWRGLRARRFCIAI